MAVWGAPVAQEDDAERAVRAALELVAVDARRSTPPSRLAPGVLTGEAAVTLGADRPGDGRRRPRQHRLADPVGRRAGHRARRRGDAAGHRGRDRLRGRRRARAEGQERAGASSGGRSRVVAARERRGPRRPALEAPFVGRDRELRSSRSCSTPRRRAQRAASSRSSASPASASRAWPGSSRSTSTGSPATSGGTAAAASPTATASRTGRSPRWCACAPGSPRTRSRTRRSAKLRAVAREHVPDEDERAWVEPRLAAPARPRGADRARPRGPLLGLAALLRADGRAEPVVMVFEDIHWADAALLEFVEYLLDWSRSHPIFVAHARAARARRAPSRLGRRASATSPRSSSSRSPTTAMDELLVGLVPGLPDDVRAHDPRARRRHPALRGRDGAHAARPRPARARGRRLPSSTGDLERARRAGDAARADRRPARRARAGGAAAAPGRRRARQDVHAARRSPRSRRPRRATSRAAAGGARAQGVLVARGRPGSPERGQYGFLQALVQRVAYETLSRRDRKARHLAAAELPRSGCRASSRTRSSR